jgi:copper chaperone
MKTIELKIEGMSCGHCVMSVRKELSKLRGIVVRDVRIGGATIDVDGTMPDGEALRAAIEDAGFSLVGMV